MFVSKTVRSTNRARAGAEDRRKPQAKNPQLVNMAINSIWSLNTEAQNELFRLLGKASKLLKLRKSGIEIAEVINAEILSKGARYFQQATSTTPDRLELQTLLPEPSLVTASIQELRTFHAQGVYSLMAAVIDQQQVVQESLATTA